VLIRLNARSTEELFADAQVPFQAALLARDGASR
jgi:hypothetical protein